MSGVVLFWLAFVILLIGLYLFNREAINNSILILQREFFSRNVPEESTSETPVEPGDVIRVTPPTQVTAPQSGTTATAPPAPVETPPSETAASQPSVTAPSGTETGNVQPQTGQNPQTTQGTQAVQGTEVVQGTTELRNRALYFIRIGSDGSVLRVRADRGLPVSDSPLRDVIQALITGPNAEERQSGLVSLIPAGTRLLSVTIRGDTAYINFSEDFQYNTYGAEGYNGQLRQIVFTATEFPNVRDVQILIESGRVDYLGENVWIGSPLSREMF